MPKAQSKHSEYNKIKNIENSWSWLIFGHIPLINKGKSSILTLRNEAKTVAGTLYYRLIKGHDQAAIGSL